MGSTFSKRRRERYLEKFYGKDVYSIIRGYSDHSILFSHLGKYEKTDMVYSITTLADILGIVYDDHTRSQCMKPYEIVYGIRNRRNIANDFFGWYHRVCSDPGLLKNKILFIEVSFDQFERLADSYYHVGVFIGDDDRKSFVFTFDRRGDFVAREVSFDFQQSFSMVQKGPYFFSIFSHAKMFGVYDCIDSIHCYAV